MGPAFAFLAACAFALGTVLQQKGTLDTTSGSGDSHWLIQILHKPVWLAGMLLQASGWVLQAVALDKGPLMAVQAITTLSLVIALPFGAWLTHQHIDRRVVLGAVAVVAGIVVFLSVGSPQAGPPIRAPAPGGSPAWSSSCWCWHGRAGPQRGRVRPEHSSSGRRQDSASPCRPP